MGKMAGTRALKTVAVESGITKKEQKLDIGTSNAADSWYAFTEEPMEYYVEKFERRVFRRLIEYQILTKHFEPDYEKEKSYVSELLSLDDEVIHGFEVKDHIEKACLTGLKTEFEHFFTIYCTFALDRQIKLVEEGEMIPKMTDKLRETVQNSKFARAFVEQRLSGARQIAVEQLLPRQGLENLEEILKVCGWSVVDDELDVQHGWDLGEEFAVLIKTPWKQIQMAFQVRHAIEHNFSKVSVKGRFDYRAVKSGALKGSTWCRWWGTPETQPPAATKCGLGQTPKVGDRVLIDHIDIRGTAAAMTWVAKQLTKHWREKLNN